ncbi:MFS transporter [Paenarthrobacter sp. RAF9]
MSTTAQQTTLRKTPGKAALASFLGSTLEYYDFFIYGSAAALVFGPLFFPSDDPAVGLIGAFATFGVAYVARPVGGLVMGHFGDKLGRKKILLITLGVMGLSSLGIGFLPSYSQIGFWAPVLLVIGRLAQGFSAGAESAGASTLTLEHSPEGRRGFFTSFVMTGYASGMVLATLVFIPVSALPTEALMSWGWRIPFWLSIVVLGIAYWVRTHLDETPVFEDAKDRRTVAPMPLREVLRFQSADVARVVGMSIIGNIFLVFAAAFINMTLLYSCFNGIWPAYFAELFAAPVRYSGMALGNQLGLVVAGFAPLIAGLLLGKGQDGWLPVAGFAVLCMAIAGVSAYFSRETAKTPIEDLGEPYWRGIAVRKP